jgi:hypothetical protein
MIKITTIRTSLMALLMGLMGLFGNLSAAEVTFQVDMNDYSGTADYLAAGVTLNGTFNAWCGNCAAMDDSDADGVYMLTLTLDPGVYEFKYTIGDWTDQEFLAEGSSCTLTTSGFTNRVLEVSADMTVPLSCWGACETCDMVVEDYMVTFQVDMNDYNGTQDYLTLGVNLNGSFNGWCGTCWPMDDSDADGVYTFTGPVAGGDVEYKFVIGDWTEGEEFPGGESCTNNPGGFWNRFIGGLAADETLDIVCWNSCDACGGGATFDEICGAEEFVVGTTITTDNTGATPDGVQAACWFDAEVESDIWFFFTAPASGSVDIETYDTGGSDDTQLAVFGSDDGTCSGTLTEVGCNDDISGSDYMSFLTVTGMTPGNTYFIQVDGWQGTQGVFDMSVTALTNDALCDAFPATVDGGVFTADNTGATADGEQGSCLFDAAVENDIWYFFTAPASGVVEIETFDTGGSDDTQIVVYSSSDGTCAGTLTEVGCNDDISGTDYMSFALVEGLTAGDTYFIQVDGWQGTQGSFDMEIRSIVLVVECPAPAAVICDNFDDYAVGSSIHDGAAYWAPWPPASTPSLVSDEQAFSNSNSLKVSDDNSEDNLLLFGNQTTGVWTVSWMMYIPTGNSAYFNVQNAETPGTWNLDAFFNAVNGSPGAGTIQQDAAAAITFPHDAWFPLTMTFNLNTNLLTMDVDGAAVLTAFAYAGNLGSINYYSNGAANTYYVDDLVFDGNPDVGLSEYTTGLFQISPNPTDGNFTVKGMENINSVVVRDILGATVAKIQTPMSQQVNIDLSGMESGMYFVEIQVGDVINVQRVIKQ